MQFVILSNNLFGMWKFEAVVANFATTENHLPLNFFTEGLPMSDFICVNGSLI